MNIRKTALRRGQTGQSLVETVLMLPLLLLVLLNAVNFGYFYLVALNLTSASRTGALYAMIGSSTPAGTALPPATGTSPSTASYLTYQDMTGALNAPGSATIQICSAGLGVSGTGSSQTAQCQTCTSSAAGSAFACGATGTGSPAPDSDPEAPAFVLNRVDVTYAFTPLIPGTPFGLALLPLSACTASGATVTCTFHRQVSMRAMGS
ncbi:MAG: pilus assembly protein [Acidobacteriia bacterium]|nr:pilus assembly protein [Terriglobia bacterium]